MVIAAYFSRFIFIWRIKMGHVVELKRDFSFQFKNGHVSRFFLSLRIPSHNYLTAGPSGHSATHANEQSTKILSEGKAPVTEGRLTKMTPGVILNCRKDHKLCASRFTSWMLFPPIPNRWTYRDVPSTN